MVRPTVDSKASILPLFPLLSSHDTPTRLDASYSLLTSLPLGAPVASGAPVEDADTPYAIKRLVNGLASSNEASRQGFAVALTELLARLPLEHSQTVLPLIISTSTPNAGADSREERDLLFARLMGLHAVIRSGVLFRPDTTNGETFKEVILALLALSGKKSWIREPAFWVLIEGVRTLLELEGEAVPDWNEGMGAWLIQRLLNDSREKARGFGPEKVGLVLVLQAHGVEADYASVLSPAFPSGNPLARSSLASLAQALKGTTVEAEPVVAAPAAKGPKMGSNAVKTSKGGSAVPGAAPHFVWNEIFELYFPTAGKAPRRGEAAIKAGRADWHDVWRVLVDQSLFAPPSLPLKATGFALLSMALTRLPPTDVPALFGEGVMRTLSNHLRKSADGEKTLTRVAEKVTASLPPFLDLNPTISLPLLKALVAPPHGSHAFDYRTVEKVVAKLDLKGVRGWIKYLKEFILGEEVVVEDGAELPEAEDEKSLAARRTWAFDQLLHVSRSGGVPKDDEILAGLLEFFAVLGWFEVRKSGKGARAYVPVPAFTDALQIAARSRFFSILTSLPSTPSPSGQTWLSRALALLDNLSADKKHFTPTAETDDEVIESRAEVKEMYVKLAGDDARMGPARGLIEGVLLLSYDEGEEASEALEQLKEVLPVLFPGVIEAAAKDDDDDDMDGEDDEEPEPATVLIDLLLELLHRPSAFVKSVSQTVFTGFADEIGEQAMELLLEQIRPDEAEEAGDEDDEDASMANGDASTSKSPVKAGKGKGKKAVVETVPDSDDDDNNDEDDSDGDDEIDEDFRNELLAALQANGVADEFDAAEENDEDSDEELLDDDQMMALDDKLADIFRLQGGGKKGKKVERTDDLHYRLRVVDLIEALNKQRVANPLLVLVLLPLLSIARGTAAVDSELQSKAVKLLRNIVARKDSPAPADPQSALDALAELHVLSQTLDAADFVSLCSQAGIFLAKAALASPAATAATSAAIATLYSDSFEAYVSKKNSKTRAQPTMSIDFARRLPATAWPLFKVVVNLAGTDSSTVNAFRRMQSLQVAQALLTNYFALKTPESKANIIVDMATYRSTIFSVLSSSLTDEKATLDAARLKEVAKLALAAARTTVSVSDPATTASIWKVDEFVTLVEGYRLSNRFRGALAIQGLLKQLITLAGGPSAKVGGKRKNADEGDKSGTKEKATKKVKSEKKGKNVEPEVEVEVEMEEEVEVVEEEVVKGDKKGSKKEKKEARDKKKEGKKGKKERV